jgi:hypothetical protein
MFYHGSRPRRRGRGAQRDQAAASNIINAFKLQVDAQTGKTISATAAELLKRLAGAP